MKNKIDIDERRDELLDLLHHSLNPEDDVAYCREYVALTEELMRKDKQLKEKNDDH